MDWIASLSGVTALFLAGRGSKWGPLVGLLGEIPWTLLVVQTDAWGLMVLNIVIGLVYWDQYRRFTCAPRSA